MNRKEAERRAVEEVRRIRKKDTGVFNPVDLLDKIERLEAENEKLRAELASIKPDWSTAPEWATTLIAIWSWSAGNHAPMPAKINSSSIYIEAKP